MFEASLQLILLAEYIKLLTFSVSDSRMVAEFGENFTLGY